MRPVIFQSDKLTVIVNGKPETVNSSHPNYVAIRDVAQNENVCSDAELVALIHPVAEKVKAILPTKTPKGKQGVAVYDGNVWFNGEVLNHILVDRILKMNEEGLDILPVCRFLENLMQNPSANSVAETYKFMETNNLTITSDGHFLAYKYVEDDYMDCHSKTIRNMVGDKPMVLRNTVDDDWRKLCSSGLHVGSYEYAFDGPGRRRMIVKVNPRDVVAVSGGEHKARVCLYEVVAELEDKRTKLPDYVDDYDPEEDEESWDHHDDYRDDEDDDYEDDDDTGACNDPNCVFCHSGIEPLVTKVPKVDTRQNYVRQQRDQFGRFIRKD